MQKAKEWVEGKVNGSGSTDTNKLSSFRTKIGLHEKTKCHKALQEILNDKEKDVLPTVFENVNSKHLETTEKVFRTAYYLCKNERPFTDHPSLIDLQQANGMDMGVLLQSRQVGGDICEFIGTEMQKKLAAQIVSSNEKVAIMIDESTTSSTATTLVVCMRTFIESSPLTFYLDLVEVEEASSGTITLKLLNALHKLGMTEEWLQKHLIGFASDGASAMLGKTSGVAARLLSKFPDLLIWHCANHRLELAVGDAVKDANGINNFRVFMDKLYTLYHASPKNRYELKECASDLEEQLYTIGRVLDTRWVSSSLRTVEAVYNNLPSLARHFNKASEDMSRKSVDRQMFKGLLNHLTTPQFVSNLCLMNDALAPLSDLSKTLQKRDITIVTAHQLIQQKITLFKWRKNHPGKCYVAFEESLEDGNNFTLEKKDDTKVQIQLDGSASIVQVSPLQFYQSLVDSLESRLITSVSRKSASTRDKEQDTLNYQELLKDLQVLEPSRWPLEQEPCFGEDAIGRLNKRFLKGAAAQELQQEFDIFKASNGSEIGEQLTVLKRAVATLIVSTAECERCFSVMNDILTPTRNSLGIRRLSMLMFVKILGPDLKFFKPTPYVKQWLREGRRSADTTASKKRQERQSSSAVFAPLQKLFNA